MEEVKRILNLGCGDDTYGTHRVDMFKTPATTEVADLNSKLPYPDDFFDEIYCRSVLEHIKNLGIFTEECYRVLKKGGKIWLRTDHAGYLFAHLLKSHETNRALDVQYKEGFGYGHHKQQGQMEDHHYALFVESNLKYLFSRFKDHKFSYVLGGRNGINKLLCKVIPKHLGAVHIELEAWK